jgi:hypothetical protein
MPSWNVHRAIYEKLRNEVPGFIIWTPNLLNMVDKIIDREYGEHDLGRRPDLGSFQRMLRALWLEFGDIYDTLSGKLLYASYSDKLRVEQEMLSNPRLQEKYMFYIPDDALALATLHHILDVAVDCLLNTYPPITIDKSVLIFEHVRSSLGRYVDQLKGLRAMGGSTFDQAFYWLIRVLMEKSQQIYAILAEYLKSKGLEPGYGYDMLSGLMQSYVKERGYYGIICVNGIWLPLAAAVKKAYEELVKGRRVTIGFSKYRGPYPPIHEELGASSVKELCEKLRSQCGSD